MLDADMKLPGPEGEPDTAACPQRLGFRHLMESEQLAEEPSRFRLATAWGRQLHVIEAKNSQSARNVSTLAISRRDEVSVVLSDSLV